MLCLDNLAGRGASVFNFQPTINVTGTVTNLSITANLGDSGGTCKWKANGKTGQFSRKANKYNFSSVAPGDISSTAPKKRTAFDVLMSDAKSSHSSSKRRHTLSYGNRIECSNCGELVSTRPCAMKRHKQSDSCRKAAERDTVETDATEGAAATASSDASLVRKQQSNTRRRYTVAFKAEVIKALETKESLLDQLKSEFVTRFGTQADTNIFDDYKTQVDIAADFGTSQSNVSKWNANKREILNLAQKEATRNCRRKTKSRYKYHDVDSAVLAKIRELRQECKRVTRRYVCREYKRELQKLNPQIAAMFKGSSSWRKRFYSRNNLVLRKKTNNHKFVWEEREPRLKAYCTGLQRRIKASTHPNAPPYSPGAYPIDKRMSLDQVPCEWGLNGKETIEFKGKDVVQIFTRKGTFENFSTCMMCVTLKITQTQTHTHTLSL